MKRVFMIVPAAFLLSACATHLTKEQCETTSWKSMGYQDAAAGNMPRDLTGSIADCAKFNLSVDTRQYMQGWKEGAKSYCTPGQDLGLIDGQAGKSNNAINYRLPVCNRAGVQLNLTQYNKGRYQGLKQYCTFENGGNIARMGQQLPDVCPAELKQKFLKGWASGKKAFCEQAANGFALGKSGKPYPAICPGSIYPSFKSEYDRGETIGNQINAGQSRLREIDNYISAKKYEFNFHSSYNGFYSLGKDQSPTARDTLAEVNHLVDEKKKIERDVFDMKVKN